MVGDHSTGTAKFAFQLLISLMAILRQLRLVWTSVFPFNSCAGSVRELIDGEQAYRTSHNIFPAPLDNLEERL